MKRYAVIGNPIAHSRSPELHHAFAQACGIALQYDKILSPTDDFANTVRQFFADGGQGLNITVPFKEQAFALSEIRTARAEIAKAVNTLWIKDGKLHGDNTDGQGLVNALTFLGWTLDNTRILILGAGGATRGVLLPLAQAGVRDIVIANRTLARAQQLVAEMQTFMGNVRPVIHTHFTTMRLDHLTSEFDLVINATSASLNGDVLILPNTLTFHHAYEMAYGKTSDFLSQAQIRGVPYSDGFSMLVGQAIEAFYIWHNIEVKLEDFLC